MALQQQTFNYDLHGLLAFQALGDLVAGCQCRSFSYSRLEEAVNAFEQWVRPRDGPG